MRHRYSDTGRKAKPSVITFSASDGTETGEPVGSLTVDEFRTKIAICLKNIFIFRFHEM